MIKKGIVQIINEFSKKLPRFPDGRIDYSDSDAAPIVVVFIKFRDEFLLLKRSDKVRAYRGKWNTVSGFLDEAKPVKDKALEEIEEELGIGNDSVRDTRVADCYESKDEAIGKTWIINPVLVELKERPEIRLDWEHSEYKWVKKDEFSRFDTVYDLGKTLERALAI